PANRVQKRIVAGEGTMFPHVRHSRAAVRRSCAAVRHSCEGRNPASAESTSDHCLATAASRRRFRFPPSPPPAPVPHYGSAPRVLLWCALDSTPPPLA